MGINLGEIFPNFTADTTHGKINFHEWQGDSWAILFSHPSDFTPVCTTELATVARLSHQGEFRKRNCKVIALSCDPVESHKRWIEDIKASQRISSVPFPIIADEKRELAIQLSMLDPIDKDKDGIPVTARAVFIIGPDNRLKLSILYPATTGRNFSEILRALDSLQLTLYESVATPADWKVGENCMIIPLLSDEEATQKFPRGFTKVQVPSGKNYIRITPQPSKL